MTSRRGHSCGYGSYSRCLAYLSDNRGLRGFVTRSLNVFPGMESQECRGGRYFKWTSAVRKSSKRPWRFEEKNQGMFYSSRVFFYLFRRCEGEEPRREEEEERWTLNYIRRRREREKVDRRSKNVVISPKLNNSILIFFVLIVRREVCLLFIVYLDLIFCLFTLVDD